MKTMQLIAGSAVALIAFSGCSDDGDDSSSSDSDSNEVGIVLSEFVVQPDSTSASAGDVTFNADNEGQDEHEFVVVKADDASELPTDADGAVDEGGLEPGQLIGEIEGLEPGASGEATLGLDSGTYVLFCNIVDEEPDGTIESHFAEGMFTTFQAE